MLSVIYLSVTTKPFMPSVIMLSVADKPFMPCRYADCHYDECHYTGCYGAYINNLTIKARVLHSGKHFLSKSNLPDIQAERARGHIHNTSFSL
jgi:hypothetical protein